MHNSKSWKFLFTAGRHVIHTRVRLRTERQIQCDVIIGKNLEGSVHLRKLRWEQREHVQRDLESQEGQAISYNRIHLPAHNISGGCNCATSTNPGVNQPMRSLQFPWISRGFVQLSKIMLRQCQSVVSRYGISELQRISDIMTIGLWHFWLHVSSVSNAMLCARENLRPHLQYNCILNQV